MNTKHKAKILPSTKPAGHVFDPISTDTIPPGSEPGAGVIVPQWTRNTFTLTEGLISAVLEQTSQGVFQPDAGGLPVWSPPYPSGSIYLSYEEIIALPSADAFFGELWALADAKLAALNAPPAPPPDVVVPV